MIDHEAARAIAALAIMLLLPLWAAIGAISVAFSARPNGAKSHAATFVRP